MLVPEVMKLFEDLYESVFPVIREGVRLKAPLMGENQLAAEMASRSLMMEVAGAFQTAAVSSFFGSLGVPIGFYTSVVSFMLLVDGRSSLLESFLGFMAMVHLITSAIRSSHQ